MNGKMAGILVAVVLATAVPTGVSQTEDLADPLPEGVLAHRPGLDGSDGARLEPIAFQEVPLSRFTDNRAAVPMNGLFGHDAGCDTAGGNAGWAVAGTPSSPCEAEHHDWGFRYAVHHCPNGCYSDGYNEERGEFGLFIISCDPGARSIFDFTTLESTNLGTGECRVVGWGQLPLNWADWSGYGQVRDMRFSYTDNLPDALGHLWF